MIASFVLGAFCAQAGRGGVQRAVKLKPAAERPAANPLAKKQIQEFNKLKTNLTAEQKKVVNLALQTLYTTVYIEVPTFKFLKNLISPPEGVIYSIKWEAQGVKEKTVIRFLQEFVNQSKEHPLTEAVNQTLLKMGLADPSNLSETRMKILENPEWFIEQIAQRGRLIKYSNVHGKDNGSGVGNKFFIEKMREFWDLKEGPSVEEKLIFAQGLQVLTLLSGSAFRKTQAYKIMDTMLNPSQWIIHSVDWKNHKISEPALRFVQAFINHSEEHSVWEAFNEAMIKTDLAHSKNVIEKQEELRQNPLWFLEPK